MKLRQRCQALTLIEVLAATVLLSLVLVGVVLARGRSTQQWSSANRMLDAARLADSWLTEQWVDLDNFPRDGQGVLDETTRLSWRTQTLSNQPIEALGGQCVRLEVYETVGSGSDDALLVIDVVLPGDPPWDEVLKYTVGDTP